MRTTLELPDSLVARLKARAALERVSLKQLLRTFVEQGLAEESPLAPRRSAADLPSIAGPEAVAGDQLSNAGLFALLKE